MARIEHVKLRQIAEDDAPVELHVRAVRDGCPPQRHVLVIGLVGRRPPREELIPRHRALLLGDVGGVVVVKLVIVPGDDPGKGFVGRLQVGVQAILRVTPAIVFEGVQLTAKVLARTIVRTGALVDVIAQMDHEVEVTGEHVPERGEVAVLVVLARNKREVEPVEILARCNRGPRPTSRTDFRSGPKLIPVPPSRLEPIDLDVNRMRQRGICRRRAALDDLEHVGVGRNTPVDFVVFIRRQSTAVERLGRQPCPEHNAVGPGVPRRHSQTEGVCRELRLPRTPAVQAENGQTEQRRRTGNKIPAVHAP